MGKHSLSRYEIKDDEDLVRAIADARETAAFFHDFVDLIGENDDTRQQISPNGWAGFAHILNALEEHLRDTTEAAEETRRKHRDEIAELESAHSVKLGLPLEACRDPKFVSAWRSGYAHARAEAEKEREVQEGDGVGVSDAPGITLPTERKPRRNVRKESGHLRLASSRPADGAAGQASAS